METIKFAKPYFTPDWERQVHELISESMRTGQLTQGPNVKKVEAYFSNLLSGRCVAATNSCTASLHLAMMLIGITKGDEVIVPSNTFAATANAVLYCDGIPVFSEINPTHNNIDPSHAAELISDRTKAIVAVHMGGNPCDMRELMSLADENGIALVEDCAHAHGAYYEGKPCGTFGKFACFSFYPTKVISSSEGGFIVTPDRNSDHRVRVLVNQGRSGFGPSEITEIGYNYRMNEIQAIMIRVQMEHLDEIVEKRTELVKRYRRNLSNISGISIPSLLPKCKSANYAFTIMIEDAIRDAVREAMQSKNIETSIMYHPVHLQPIYRKLLGHKPGDLPITEAVCSRSLSLPLHLGLKVKDIDYVCTELIAAIGILTTH